MADLPAGRQAHTPKYMYFVYALKSQVRKYTYIGLTNNLERRINQHQQGRERTTKPYKPFEIKLTEMYNSRVEARSREKYLKSGVGKEWLKSL